jgi:regulatory protein
MDRAHKLAHQRIERREYSSLEMKRYLLRKGVSPEEAEDAVNELVRQGLINNQRYAELYARSLALRGKASRYIALKLKEKGVSLEPEKIQQALREINGVDELEAAIAWVERRFPDRANDRRMAARAYQALIRRGYSHEIARKAVFSDHSLDV